MTGTSQLLFKMINFIFKATIVIEGLIVLGFIDLNLSVEVFIVEEFRRNILMKIIIKGLNH